MTDNPFEKVLDRLREKGWCKDQYGDLATGPNCIAGAALAEGVFEHGYWGENPTAIQLEAVIREQYGMVIPAFNDHPDTTFSDVERVLEKAAVKWEEERVTR